MAYSTINIVKFNNTDRGSIVKVAKHNFREEISRNVNKKKIHLNEYLMGSKTMNILEEVEKRLENVDKYRKDANIVCNVCLSASPEWFIGKSKNQVKEWQEETLNFMIEQFGKDNILYAVVHNDEKTPHIHFALTPIKDNKLRSNIWFDGPSKLKRFHTEYSKKMKKFGLKRGKTEVKSSQEEIQDFYNKVNTSTVYDRQMDKKVEELLQQLESPNFFQKLSVNKFREEIVQPLLKQIANQAKHYRAKTLAFEKKAKDFDRVEQEAKDLELKLETLGLKPNISFLELNELAPSIKELVEKKSSLAKESSSSNSPQDNHTLGITPHIKSKVPKI